MQLKQMKKLARQFREERPNIPERKGFVIFWLMQVTAWTLDLEDPKRWSPGCIAINSEGALWEAKGGNEQDGAERWEPLTKQEDYQCRVIS